VGGAACHDRRTRPLAGDGALGCFLFSVVLFLTFYLLPFSLSRVSVIFNLLPFTVRRKPLFGLRLGTQNVSLFVRAPCRAMFLPLFCLSWCLTAYLRALLTVLTLVACVYLDVARDSALDHFIASLILRTPTTLYWLHALLMILAPCYLDLLTMQLK